MVARTLVSDTLNGKVYVDQNKKIDTAKWYLERKARNEFAQRLEHTGADGAPIQTEITLNDEQYARAVQAEAERLSAGQEQSN
jgi:hypothetical protein